MSYALPRDHRFIALVSVKVSSDPLKQGWEWESANMVSPRSRAP